MARLFRVPRYLSATSGQVIRVAAVSAGNTPDLATYLNVYVNGAKAGRIATNSGSAAGSGGFGSSNRHQ